MSRRRRQQSLASMLRILVAGAVAAAVSALPAQPVRHEAARAACRRTVGATQAVQLAVREVAPLLPADGLRAILFAPFPAGTAERARAALVAAPADDPGAGPLLYWSPAATGADVLHELVHAVYGALDDDGRAALVARVAAHDSTTGFPAPVVDGAVRSVVWGLATGLGATADPRLVRALLDAAPRGSQAGAGALAARHAALSRVLASPRGAPARALLARGVSGVSAPAGADWRAVLRSFLLSEAHAYEAADRCLRGEPSELWTVASR